MTTTTITDTTRANLDAVGRLYAASGRGDLDAVLAEVADDVDWAAEAAGTAAPWYGRHRGHEGVERFFAAIAEALDITEFDIVGMTANESDVVTTVHWTYTVKATGRRASMYMQHWWRLADGRIVFFRGSEDSLQTAVAFGKA
jgi:ketosteroid isomerase-like protein